MACVVASRGVVALVGVASLCAGTAAPLEAGDRPVAAPVPARVRHGERRRHLVHFEDVVRNEGAAPLRDVRVDLLLPLEGARQSVRWLRLSPHDWTIRTDVHGQRVATATVAALAPGAVTAFSWIASIEVADETHEPPSAAAGDVPKDVARYLADAEAFGLTSDAVRAAADEVVAAAGGDRSPMALVRAAAGYVREKIAYAREGGWDAAPVVLARGTGSCSEATYTFAAICRRLGVPVRWTGGTMLRDRPRGRAIDTTFHRIAEAWVPGHGWVPVEATKARAEGADVWKIPASMLQLARGDGSGDAGAGWSYYARERWKDPTKGSGAKAGRRSRRAAWLSGVDDELATAGSLKGLGADEHPSFARAELVACDARGFGPPRTASGDLIARAAPLVRLRAIEAARMLLAAGHPEGVRLAAESGAASATEAAELLRASCDAALADEVVPLLGADAAKFEAWWAANLDRVEPEDRGRLTLVTRSR